MRWWPGKGLNSLKDIARSDGHGWRTFQELLNIRKTRVAPQLYNIMHTTIPWEATPRPPLSKGQWLAQQEEDGCIRFVYHLQQTDPPEATLYKRESNEQLGLLGTQQRLPPGAKEVRIIRTLGPKQAILDFNPTDETPVEQTLWLWGNTWLEELDWDPKDWSWRRLGMLPDTSILNYTTKRGYRIALRQDNHQMTVDAELEVAGFDGKSRAKFWNRIWHPYLPSKVFAMQWLILTQGLPVGAWREKLGLNGTCHICTLQEHETLQHAFIECTEV